MSASSDIPLAMPAQHYDYIWTSTTQTGAGVAWSPPGGPYSTGSVLLGAGQSSATRTSTPGTVLLFSSTTGLPLPSDAYIVGVELSLIVVSTAAGILADDVEVQVGGAALGDIGGDVPLSAPGTYVFGTPTYLGGRVWSAADLATLSWRFVARASGAGGLLGMNGVQIRIHTGDAPPPSVPILRRPVRIPPYRRPHAR